MSKDADIAKIVDVITKRVKSLNDLKRSIKAAKTARSWDMVTVLAILQRAIESPRLDSELKTEFHNSIGICEKAVEHLVLELEAQIRDLCTERKWRLDGQWPTLFVERAVELRFDEKRRQLFVSDKRLSHLDIELIASTLNAAIEQLLPKGFSTSRFAEDFHRAYEHARRKVGNSVPILEVYRAMVVAAQPRELWRNARADRFVELRVEQFRARLTKLLEEKKGSLFEKGAMRFYPPINPDDAIFIFLPSESRFAFIGRVEIQEESPR